MVARLDRRCGSLRICRLRAWGFKSPLPHRLIRRSTDHARHRTIPKISAIHKIGACLSLGTHIGPKSVPKNKHAPIMARAGRQRSLRSAAMRAASGQRR